MRVQLHPLPLLLLLLPLLLLSLSPVVSGSSSCIQCVSQIVYGFDGKDGRNGTDAVIPDYTVTPLVAPLIQSPVISGTVTGNPTFAAGTTLVAPTITSLLGSPIGSFRGEGSVSATCATATQNGATVTIPSTCSFNVAIGGVLSWPELGTSAIALSQPGSCATGCTFQVTKSQTIGAPGTTITASNYQAALIGARVTAPGGTHTTMIMGTGSGVISVPVLTVSDTLATRGATQTLTATTLANGALTGTTTMASGASISAAGTLPISAVTSATITAPSVTITAPNTYVSGVGNMGDQVRVMATTDGVQKKIVLRDLGSNPTAQGNRFAGFGYTAVGGVNALRSQISATSEKFSWMVGSSADSTDITASAEVASISGVGVQTAAGSMSVSPGETAVVITCSATQDGTIITFASACTFPGSWVMSFPTGSMMVTGVGCPDGCAAGSTLALVAGSTAQTIATASTLTVTNRLFVAARQSGRYILIQNSGQRVAIPAGATILLPGLPPAISFNGCLGDAFCPGQWQTVDTNWPNQGSWSGSWIVCGSSTMTRAAVSAPMLMSTRILLFAAGLHEWTISGARANMTVSIVSSTQAGVVFALTTTSSYVPTTAAGQPLFILSMISNSRIFTGSLMLLGVTTYGQSVLTLGWGAAYFPTASLTSTVSSFDILRTITVSSGATAIPPSTTSQWTLLYAGL